jgi:hypothetical protein
MAITSVNATYQGVVSYAGGIFNDWVTDIRDEPVGDTSTTYTADTLDATAVRVSYDSGRGGDSGTCHRTFLFFENIDAAVGGGNITAATLKVPNGGSGTSTQTIVVNSQAWGSDGSDGNLNDGNYSDVNFNVPYSDELPSWQGGSFNNFDLNSDAITNMNFEGYLNCAIIEYTYDFSGTNPSAVLDDTAPITFLNSGNEIVLEITYTPAGYSNKVVGVVGASIGKVIGVSSANISKVIGVQ